MRATTSAAPGRIASPTESTARACESHPTTTAVRGVLRQILHRAGQPQDFLLVGAGHGADVVQCHRAGRQRAGLVRSASRRAEALLARASLTSRVIWASFVTAPTLVARTTSLPLRLTQAPVDELSVRVFIVAFSQRRASLWHHRWGD